MHYQKSVIQVKLRLDPVPGWGDKPEDHVEMLKNQLEQSVGHYKPEVTLIAVENEKVICARHKGCKHEKTCGAAKPHDYDGNECGKCPMDESSVCIAVGDYKG